MLALNRWAYLLMGFGFAAATASSVG